MQSEGRIAKRIARSGLCSRRTAERWILEGRVAIDGKKLSSPAVNVSDGQKISVDGQPLPDLEPPRLWLYHKPAGLLTTHRDVQGRSTVFDSLPPDLPRVISVGRLDLNSEGLLLLTNDGTLAQHLELPSSGWVRAYRARVFGALVPARLSGLSKGVTVDGFRYAPIRAVIDKQNRTNSWLRLSLTEGRNREVRRVLTHLDLKVSRLIRISYGPFQLGKLRRGKVEEVSSRTITKLLNGYAAR